MSTDDPMIEIGKCRLPVPRAATGNERTALQVIDVLRDQLAAMTARAEAAEADARVLAAFLKRAIKFVEDDARMMADITRHSPLPTEEQTKHDNTESLSEVLIREVSADASGSLARWSKP